MYVENSEENSIEIAFFNTFPGPWLLALSRSRQQKYFYNKSTGESTFVVPADGSHAASLKLVLALFLSLCFETGRYI